MNECKHSWGTWKLCDIIERTRESHVMGMPPSHTPTQVFKVEKVYVKKRECAKCGNWEWQEHSVDAGIACVQDGLRVV